MTDKAISSPRKLVSAILRRATSERDGKRELLVCRRPCPQQTQQHTESKRSENTDDDDDDVLKLEDRPNTLPPKDPAEHKRQLQQYQKLRAHAAKMAEAERAEQARREERKSHAQTAWLNEIIPNWQSALKSGHAREACRDGIPPSVRVFAWPLLLRNALNITPGMHDTL